METWKPWLIIGGAIFAVCVGLAVHYDNNGWCWLSALAVAIIGAVAVMATTASDKKPAAEPSEADKKKASDRQAELISQFLGVCFVLGLVGLAVYGIYLVVYPGVDRMVADTRANQRHISNLLPMQSVPDYMAVGRKRSVSAEQQTPPANPPSGGWGDSPPNPSPQPPGRWCTWSPVFSPGERFIIKAGWGPFRVRIIDPDNPSGPLQVLPANTPITANQEGIVQIFDDDCNNIHVERI